MKLALALAVASLPPSVYPWPIGVGPRYHPTAGVHAVGSLRCDASPARFAAHVELFANRRVIVVPAGIGLAPGCAYPVRTVAPTGVVRVARPATLGDLFRIWGRRLGPHRLLSFAGRVEAFVGGRRVSGDPQRIPLTPHAQIVLEVGGHVAPHPSYVFPKGTP
jgi:hypothetical protein